MPGVWTYIKRGFVAAPHVTVLRLSGVIGGGGRFGRALEDAALASLVERAFKPRRLAAVALAINSPGGSPAQSSLIAQRIRDHAREREVPVIAFCEDVAASGGYMLACAADEIWADRFSILGSIGVVSASFGFAEALSRLGVERRLQTAGAAKARLDPFSPLKPEDEAWLKALQGEMHDGFIEMVKASRGEKLNGAPPELLFSGEVFLGEEAVRLGLADGVGRLRPTLRERFGEQVVFEVVAPRRGLFSRLSPFAEGAVPAETRPMLSAEDWLGALERRALWSRFGL